MKPADARNEKEGKKTKSRPTLGESAMMEYTSIARTLFRCVTARLIDKINGDLRNYKIKVVALRTDPAGGVVRLVVAHFQDSSYGSRRVSTSRLISRIDYMVLCVGKCRNSD